MIPPLARVCPFFLEYSTRTSDSYSQAAEILGFKTEQIRGKEATSLMKGESFANTIRMKAEQGADIIVIRSPWEGVPRFAAEIIDKLEIMDNVKFHVAIQNAGDGANQHPSPALLDLLAIKKRRGRIENFTLGIIGSPFSRTINSLMASLRNKNVKLIWVAPSYIKPEPRYEKIFPNISFSEFLEALLECDIIYLNRIQEERLDKEKVEEIRRWIKERVIDEKFTSSLVKKSFIMHPQPCREEIDPKIRTLPCVIIDEQSWYGIPCRIELLERGYHSRKDVFTIPKPEKFRVLIINRHPISVKVTRKRNMGGYFAPIEKGVVLDHLPPHPDVVDEIRSILHKGGVFSKASATVSATKVPSPTKKVYGGKKVLLK